MTNISQEIKRTRNLIQDSRPEPTTLLERIAFRAWGADFQGPSYGGIPHSVYDGRAGMITIRPLFQRPFSDEYREIEVSWTEIVVSEKSISDDFTHRHISLSFPVEDGDVDEKKVMDGIREATIQINRNRAMLR